MQLALMELKARCEAATRACCLVLVHRLAFLLGFGLAWLGLAWLGFGSLAMPIQWRPGKPMRTSRPSRSTKWCLSAAATCSTASAARV